MFECVSTLFYSVWGRVVADIPDFNRELVAALAEGEGEGRRTSGYTNEGSDLAYRPTSSPTITDMTFSVLLDR